MTSSKNRLRALPVPSGTEALSVLTDLRRALDGSGPAVAPHAVSSTPPPIPDDQDGLPAGLALTIGTSGSTGRPKIAMQTGVVPATTDRTRTWSPAMWWAGRAISHWPGPPRR